jgi:hypothetical protein
MTANTSIDPARLLEEQPAQASPDLLRELLGTFINTLLSAEADAVCGAQYGTVTAHVASPALEAGRSQSRRPCRTIAPSRSAFPYGTGLAEPPPALSIAANSNSWVRLAPRNPTINWEPGGPAQLVVAAVSRTSPTTSRAISYNDLLLLRSRLTSWSLILSRAERAASATTTTMQRPLPSCWRRLP